MAIFDLRFSIFSRRFGVGESHASRLNLSMQFQFVLYFPHDGKVAHLIKRSRAR